MLHRLNQTSKHEPSPFFENGKMLYETGVKYTSRPFMDDMVELTQKVRGFVFHPPIYHDRASMAFKTWHDAKLLDPSMYEGKSDFIKPLSKDEKTDPSKSAPLTAKQKSDFISIITAFCQEEDFALTYILEVVLLDWMQAEFRRLCGEDYAELKNKILFHKTSLYDDVKYKTDYILSLRPDSGAEQHFSIDLKISDNDRYVNHARNLRSTAVCAEYKYYRWVSNIDEVFPRFIFRMGPAFAFLFLREYMWRIMWESPVSDLDPRSFAEFNVMVAEESIRAVTKDCGSNVINALEKTRHDFAKLLEKDIISL